MAVEKQWSQPVFLRGASAAEAGLELKTLQYLPLLLPAPKAIKPLYAKLDYWSVATIPNGHPVSHVWD